MAVVPLLLMVFLNAKIVWDIKSAQVRHCSSLHFYLFFMAVVPLLLMVFLNAKNVWGITPSQHR